MREEEGERGGRMLRVVAQAGSDLADTGAVEEADRRVAQQGHGQGALAAMDGALVLPRVTSLTRWSLFSIAQWPRLRASSRSGGPTVGGW